VRDCVVDLECGSRQPIRLSFKIRPVSGRIESRHHADSAAADTHQNRYFRAHPPGPRNAGRTVRRFVSFPASPPPGLVLSISLSMQTDEIKEKNEDEEELDGCESRTQGGELDEKEET